MLIHSFIASYGYLVLFLGIFIEGETFLILAGFAAHQGHMHFPWVVLIGFLGAFLYSQIVFFLGRLKIKIWLKRYSSVHSQIQSLHGIIEKNQIFFILGFMFLYGLRTISLLALGTSDVGRKKFILFSLIGTFLWSSIITTLGYIFGMAIESFFGKIRHLQVAALIILSFVFVVFLIRTLLKWKYPIKNI
jgi:membrane protein DedA with SNARE-associated domain